VKEAKYNYLLKNNTRRLVPLPHDRKPAKCKWVYKVKTHFDGFVAKFKAHIMAKGYTHQHGVDCNQAFNPIVKYESIKTVLVIVAQQKMEIVQFIIQTTFIHGFLDIVNYMVQPQGFEVTNSIDSQLVCLSLKISYGFKTIWPYLESSF
jgi:hypothetical protein